MKTYGIPMLLFAIGTLLGVYGQGFAYWLNDLLPAIDPLTYLIVLTALSILAFAASAIVFWRTARKSEMEWELFKLLMCSLFLAGGLISCWTVFALLFWIG